MSSSARKDSPTIVKDELLLHIDQIVFAIAFWAFRRDQID